MEGAFAGNCWEVLDPRHWHTCGVSEPWSRTKKEGVYMQSQSLKLVTSFELGRSHLLWTSSHPWSFGASTCHSSPPQSKQLWNKRTLHTSSVYSSIRGRLLPFIIRLSAFVEDCPWWTHQSHQYYTLHALTVTAMCPLYSKCQPIHQIIPTIIYSIFVRSTIIFGLCLSNILMGKRSQYSPVISICCLTFFPLR